MKNVIFKQNVRRAVSFMAACMLFWGNLSGCSLTVFAETSEEAVQSQEDTEGMTTSDNWKEKESFPEEPDDPEPAEDSALPVILPVITYEHPYDAEDQVNWAQSASDVAFTLLPENVSGVEGIYYSVGDEVVPFSSMLKYDTETLIPFLSDTVYHFCLQDEEGNVSELQSVHTRKLDTVPPHIIVKDDDQIVDDQAIVYMNRDSLAEGKRSFTVEVMDEGSGYDDSLSLVTEYMPQDAEQSEVDTLINRAVDHVKNEASHSFTVVYDVDAPEIKKVFVNQSEENMVLTRDDVLVQVEVCDDYLEKVVLINVDDHTEQIPMARIEDEALYTGVVCTDTYKKGTYQVAAYDFAGNVSYSGNIQIEIDRTPPVLVYENIAIDQTANEEGWVKEDTSFVITVDQNEGSSAAVYVEYKKAEADSWIRLTDGEKDGDMLHFSFKETDDAYDGTYLFRAGDFLGNVSEEPPVSFRFRKDKKVPESGSILVSYRTDGGSSDLISVFSGLVARLFAKQEIEAVLYIEDELSGIKSVDYSYGSELFTVKADPEDMVRIEGIRYTVVKCILTGEHADFLKICRIEDRAGNILQENVVPSVVAKGTAILTVDSIPPTVTAVYPDCSHSEAGKKYYKPAGGRNSETVKLVFTETRYEEQTGPDGLPVKPEIQIYKDGVRTETCEDLICWDRFSGGQITARICLPYGEKADGEEIAYRVTANYQDGSGNCLVWQGKSDFFSSVADETGFRSGLFILDNKAPKLAAYSVTGRTDYMTEDKIPVYKNNGRTGDVTVSFTIMDREEDWNPGAVRFTIWNQTEAKAVVHIDGSHPDLRWSNRDGSHIGNYVFTGSRDTAARYTAQIFYADRAGNLLEADSNSSLTAGSVKDGACISAEFILDHEAPVFEIRFNDAFRLIDGETKDYSGQERTPRTDMTSYYGKSEGKIEIALTLKESCLIKDVKNKNGIADFTFHINDRETAMQWSRSGAVYTGRCTILDDGDYEISVSYQDAVGNCMVPGAVVHGAELSETGIYTSPHLILDTRAPLVTASYTDSPVATCAISGEDKGRVYFDKPVNLTITVDDQNIRFQELKEVIKCLKVCGSTQEPLESQAQIFIEGLEDARLYRPFGSVYEAPWSITIPLYTNGRYDIPVAFTDLAGNRSEYNQMLRSCTDTTQPEKLELTYETAPSGYKDAVNYKDFGFLFSDSKLTICADVSDAVSGIAQIRFTVTDDKGQSNCFEKSFAPSASGKYETALPLASGDFRGTVLAEVLDWSGNKSERMRNHVVESASTHKGTSALAITTLTKPGRTVNGKDFYNTDIQFNLSIKDRFSGIKNWSYQGGKSLSDSADYAKEAGRNMDRTPTKGIVYEYSKDLMLTALANNENDVKVWAEYTDNTGHTGRTEQSYNIDITAPVITVEYDQEMPGENNYYGSPLAATVTIQERNFSENDVEFMITNTEGAMPSIGMWSESGLGDDTRHVCRILFDSDGDYTFTASFMDQAGNRADYRQVDAFTIDRTEPVLTVSFDETGGENGYYYAKSRTASIDILEHNFDPSLIKVELAAQGAEVPSVSGWVKEGDHHKAFVVFDKDGAYTFHIRGSDLAGNILSDYEPERFVIDRTPPELMIAGVKDRSANNGAVQPVIICKDTNYDEHGLKIMLTGSNHREEMPVGVTSRIPDGLEVKLNDFPYVQDADDLYTVKAEAFDLAGNISETDVTFSVNRFGSVYQLDEATERLAGGRGTYYTKESQDIVITETNVDTLAFKELTCSLNGDLKTLEEGKDFTVNINGMDAGWKQYTYHIDRKNFETEGVYVLTLYSQDQAKNVSANGVKGKKIEFAVDRTSPSILISGVEDDGQYKESNREVTLDVEDNICLEAVEVIKNHEKIFYNAAQLAEQDGRITFDVEGSNRWQELSVTAFDAAGNREVSGSLKFLVTPNIFVQFFTDKIKFYGAAAAFVLAVVCLWGVFRRKMFLGFLYDNKIADRQNGRSAGPCRDFRKENARFANKKRQEDSGT